MEVALLSGRIKNKHLEIIQLLSENDHLPIGIYKPWVSQYRKLKKITIELPSYIQLQKKHFMRSHQINDLVNISPDRN